MLSRPLLSLNPARNLVKYPRTNHQRLSRPPSLAGCTRLLSFTRNDPPKPPPKPQPLAIRLLPTALQPDEQSSSSLKRIYQLALTEKKPLSMAIGLVSRCRNRAGSCHLTRLLSAPRFFLGFNVCAVYYWTAHRLLYFCNPSKHPHPVPMLLSPSYRRSCSVSLQQLQV